MTAWAREATPEALFVLFRDWQRTQTQSSAIALRSLRQQMDVRSCASRDHQPRGTRAQADGRIRSNARSPERAQESRAFFLTDDLHGWRFRTNRDLHLAAGADDRGADAGGGWTDAEVLKRSDMGKILCNAWRTERSIPCSFNALRDVAEMAWKRSSVRSRPGPPIKTYKFTAFSEQLRCLIPQGRSLG
jgi:hypothetical protein